MASKASRKRWRLREQSRNVSGQDKLPAPGRDRQRWPGGVSGSQSSEPPQVGGEHGAGKREIKLQNPGWVRWRSPNSQREGFGFSRTKGTTAYCFSLFHSYVSSGLAFHNYLIIISKGVSLPSTSAQKHSDAGYMHTSHRSVPGWGVKRKPAITTSSSETYDELTFMSGRVTQSSKQHVGARKDSCPSGYVPADAMNMLLKS